MSPRREKGRSTRNYSSDGKQPKTKRAEDSDSGSRSQSASPPVRRGGGHRGSPEGTRREVSDLPSKWSRHRDSTDSESSSEEEMEMERGEQRTHQ